MIQINEDELAQISAAGISEASCISGFSALGALGGFIAGGIATGGIGMGAGAMWGFSFGTTLGTSVCLV